MIKIEEFYVSGNFSPIFGKWKFYELAEKSNKIVSIPKAFAHCFLAL